MKTQLTLSSLRQKAKTDLVENVLPFWHRHGFNERGGLAGHMSNDLRLFPDVPQHVVLCSRVLWTFAEAQGMVPDPRWQESARKALALLEGGFCDKQNGGVFWSLDPDGKVRSDRKQIYAQAFTIYGLVAWWQASGERAALDRAREIFRLIEAHARDRERGGYVEALSRTWGPLEDMRLSDKDLNAPKSYNTLLHVLEAYTVLLRATGDPVVREALASLLAVMLERLVSHEPFAHCDLFFDMDWKSLVSTISFGHDIEASWLYWEAAVALKDPALEARTREATLALADAVLAHGVDADGAVAYEGKGMTVTNPDRHWWAQAEGVVGFLNAWQISGKNEYCDAALRVWQFIDERIIDHDKGEWFAIIDGKGNLLPDYPTHPDSGKMGPWKCPYHNGRAAMEILKRLPE